jgi:hypothetical protein
VELGLESLPQAAHPRVLVHGRHVHRPETERVDAGLPLLHLLLLRVPFLSLLLHRVA